MKSKAPLALMEQLTMILVFALAAALCLQLFVLSNALSRDGEIRDRAVTAVQNAAEALKIHEGNFDKLATFHGGELMEDGWQIGYDEKWKVAPVAQADFVVTAVPVEDGQPLMGSADITARGVDGKQWFEITVSWQENSNG